MNLLDEPEKTMTMQEIADAMGVSKDTVRNCVRRIFPNKMQQGKTAYFNENEVACISKELKNNAYVDKHLTSEESSQVKNTATDLEVIGNAIYKQNKTWIPYSKYAKCGYFEIKQSILENEMVVYNIRVIQKGREFLVGKYSRVEPWKI